MLNKDDLAGWYVDEAGHKILITSAINDQGYHIYHTKYEHVYTERQAHSIIADFKWARRPE